jgi:hypothetical protein
VISGAETVLDGMSGDWVWIDYEPRLRRHLHFP